MVLVLSRNRSVSPAQSDVSSGRAGDDCHQLFVMAMTATSTAVDNVNHNQLVTNMSSTSNSYSTGMLLRGGVHQPSSVTSFLPISSRPPRILESPSSDFAINYSHSVSRKCQPQSFGRILFYFYQLFCHQYHVFITMFCIIRSGQRCRGRS